MAIYKYKVTNFDTTILDNEKNKNEKIRAQLEEQLGQHANEGWQFIGQYNFPVKIEETGCFGGGTGKTSASINTYQLVFRKEV